MYIYVPGIQYQEEEAETDKQMYVKHTILYTERRTTCTKGVVHNGVGRMRMYGRKHTKRMHFEVLLYIKSRSHYLHHKYGRWRWLLLSGAKWEWGVCVCVLVPSILASVRLFRCAIFSVYVLCTRRSSRGHTFFSFFFFFLFVAPLLPPAVYAYCCTVLSWAGSAVPSSTVNSKEHPHTTPLEIESDLAASR